VVEKGNDKQYYTENNQFYIHTDSEDHSMQKTNATYNNTVESFDGDNSNKRRKDLHCRTEPNYKSNLFEKEFQNEKDNYIIQLKSSSSKVEESVRNDMNSQSESFKMLKQKKMLKLSEKGIRSKPFIKRKDDILRAAECSKHEDTMIILNNIRELSERKLQITQSHMQSEVECFINLNLEEMYKGISELKLSYECEIKQMEDNGYPTVVKGLLEEMKVEMETLKEQYEESRRKGIEVAANDPPEEKKFLQRVRNEAELDVYDVTVDLREMCMQFGYLTMFSPIWPITAVSFIINNLVEIRGDAAKICMEMQRPIPHRADSIGPWLHNLSFLTWLGSISSAALIYMFSNTEETAGLPPQNLTMYGLLLSVFFSEHIYFSAHAIVAFTMSKIQSQGLETERKEKYMVRKRYLEESFGAENELLREEDEKTGGAFTGVGVVKEGKDGRGLDEGVASAKFWSGQVEWQDSLRAGVNYIESTTAKKTQ